MLVLVLVLVLVVVLLLLVVEVVVVLMLPARRISMCASYCLRVILVVIARTPSDVLRLRVRCAAVRILAWAS